MKRQKLSKTEQKELQQATEKKDNRIMAAIGIVLLLITVGYFAINMYASYKTENAYKKYIGKQIPEEMVCMVSNMVKGSPIEAYNIHSEIYYGCCSKCEYKLRHNINHSQEAIDPFSGKIIRKNKAYITLEPNIGNVVSYFETEANYKQYLDKKKKSGL